MPSIPTPATTARGDDSLRLTYEEQLHVWIVGLRLGVFGRISNNEHVLIVDRTVAVVELNRHCDVLVTEANVRTVVATFRRLQPPYSSREPAVARRKPQKKAARPAAKGRVRLTVDEAKMLRNL